MIKIGRGLSTAEWQHLLKTQEDELTQLRGTLSLAEEGLANYAQENQELLQEHARFVNEKYEAIAECERLRWLIANGEKYFGSLWREATQADVDAIRHPPQSGEQAPAGAQGNK